MEKNLWSSLSYYSCHSKVSPDSFLKTFDSHSYMTGPRTDHPELDGSFMSPVAQTPDYRMVAKTPAITTNFQAEMKGPTDKQNVSY